MKKIALIGGIIGAIAIFSLVSCHDDTPNQTAIIQAQGQALTQQQQVITQLQQGAAVVAQNAQVSAPAVVAPAPVIVQQPAVVNNADNGLVTGMVLGHMLAGGGYSGSHTTVVNHYHTSRTTYTPRYVSHGSFFASRTVRSYSRGSRSFYSGRSFGRR